MVTSILLWPVVHSPFGKALRAIRDSASRAEFIGIAVRSLRWRAFVISGMVTGLAGALAGQVDRQVTPHQLDWFFSAQMVVATMLGGTGPFFGPAAGALAVVALRELALRFPVSHGLLFGVLLIAVSVAAPAGLAGVIVGALDRFHWSAPRPGGVPGGPNQPGGQ